MIERLPNRLTQSAVFAMTLYTAGANADDFSAPRFSFNGFGTLGVAHSSERDADFRSSPFEPNGAGYSHTCSADVDSLIGGQVAAIVTPKLPAVAQVIAEQNCDNSYRPQNGLGEAQGLAYAGFRCARRSHHATDFSALRRPCSGFYLSLGATAHLANVVGTIEGLGGGAWLIPANTTPPLCTSATNHHI